MVSTKQRNYIDEATTYHEASEEQRLAYSEINKATAQFLEIVFSYCPENADRTDALRKIREARMMANAAIACASLQVPRDDRDEK